MSWIQRVFGDFTVLEGRTDVESGLNINDMAIDGSLGDFDLSPLQVRAEYRSGSSTGQGILLQGRDGSTKGPDKAPITWITENRAPDRVIANMVAHEADNEFTIYTRDNPLSTETNSVGKRLNIDAGTARTLAEIHSDASNAIFVVRPSSAGDVAQLRMGDEAGGERYKFQRKANSDFVLDSDTLTNIMGVIGPSNAAAVTPGEVTFGAGPTRHVPQDVRTITDPRSGQQSYHDGSGANTEGPAHYTSGGAWVSTVDGTTIA